MSPKIPSLAAGLTALGVSWSAMFCVAQDPSTPTPSAATAPSPSDAPSPKLTVLLMSNGDVLQGEILEDDRSYLVKVKLGEIRRSKRDVEAAFPTVQDAYQYKRERLAPRDPDEHMNLAKWCMRHRLDTEACAELKDALALDSSNGQAKSMLFLLEAQLARRNEAKADPKIERTSGELPVDPAMPPPLNLSGVRQQKAAKRVPSGPPVILDLPPGQALRQYQEFARFVHPQLQRTCIRCHSEQTESAFQLVPAIGKRDMASDPLIRANLDAVLRLISPGELDRSELLLTTLAPHPPGNKPLFRGPNDPTYQVFATWVSRLKNESSRSPEAAPSLASKGAPAEGFATSRGAIANQVPPQPAGAQAGPAVAGKKAAASAAADNADFRTVSPLLSPTNPTKAQVGAPVAKVDSSGVPASVVVGPDGKQKVVPLGPDGKPIPEAPTELSKDRKPKTLKIDPDKLSGFLNKPR